MQTLPTLQKGCFSARSLLSFFLVFIGLRFLVWLLFHTRADEADFFSLPFALLLRPRHPPLIVSEPLLSTRQTQAESLLSHRPWRP